MPVIPVSAVIATKDRPEKLANLFLSLRDQDASLAEVVIVDASEDDRTRALCRGENGIGAIRWARADRTGAAAQRNQGVRMATHPFILFVDDDVVLERGCLSALWEAMEADPSLGGVDAIITNQCYHPLGRISRKFFNWLDGCARDCFAGRVAAGIAAFHPEDREDRESIVLTEWLASTCVLYRRSALPDPPFDPFFDGYSYGEDLALSLVVARNWRLANTRKARAFHDATPGASRLGAMEFARMSLVNRHFILTRIQNRSTIADGIRLMAFEGFSIASTLRSAGGWARLPAVIAGKVRGIWEVLGTRR